MRLLRGKPLATTITWKKPILVDHIDPPGTNLPDRMADKEGLYFFSRRFGDGLYQPFYIGQSVHLKTRLEQYLCNKGKHETRIRNVIVGEEDAYSGIQLSNGPRFYHYGYLTPRSGQQRDLTLDRAERAMIQYARIVGWKLINNHHASDQAFHRFEMEGSRFGGLLPGIVLAHKS